MVILRVKAKIIPLLKGKEVEIEKRRRRNELMEKCDKTVHSDHILPIIIMISNSQ